MVEKLMTTDKKVSENSLRLTPKQKYIVGKVWPVDAKTVTTMQEDILYLIDENAQLRKSFDADQKRIELFQMALESATARIADLESKLAIAIECIERYPGDRAKDTLSKLKPAGQPREGDGSDG